MQKMTNFFRRYAAVAANLGIAVFASLVSLPAMASYDVNIPQPASPIPQHG